MFEKITTFSRDIKGGMIKSPNFDKNLYLVLLVISIIIATVISSGFSRDSVGYNAYIVQYGETNWSELTKELFNLEGMFVLLSKVIYKSGLDFIFLFLVYASISLSVKFYLIYKHSKDVVLSLSFFTSYYFILQDSTQIRFSIAVAFSYLGLHFLAANKKVLFSLIVVFSSVMFHTAISIFIIMLLFKSKKSIYWILGMLVVSILLYPVNINFLLLDAVKNIVYYLDLERVKILYRVMVQPSSDIFLSMFARPAVLSYICAAVLFHYRDKFSAFEKLCYNSFIFSIFCYILLKDIPDLQVRLRDLFGFSLVFLVPYLFRGLSIFLGEKLAYVFLMSYLLVHLIKFAFYDKMLIF